MLADCRNDFERNKYKSDKNKLFQKEMDEWLKNNDSEFYKVQRIGDFVDVFEMICQRVEIPDCEKGFVHFIDHRYLYDTTRGYRYENISPDYECVLKNGLISLKYEIAETKFCIDYNRTIEALMLLAKRIAEKCEQPYREYFVRMSTTAAESFEEGLQRILFFDQIFWQMGQRLMGLGHLDMLLGALYEHDIQEGVLSVEMAEDLLSDFFRALHRYCWLKSNMLLNDTGQIIILGDRDEQDNYKYNELTLLCMKVAAKCGLPDPKVLLRVSKDMPKVVMASALECMKSGVGSPILSNDEQVIPRLLDFGVPISDARHYGTAACWEPLIPGKSISPNNIKSITYPKVMQRVWKRDDIGELSSYDKWMNAFYEELQKEIDELWNIISVTRFQYNPYLSIFMKDCYEKRMDVSYGGAAYNSYGLTTVGLSNTVNAIYNLRDLVFDSKQYSILQVRDILESDFEGNEDLRVLLGKNERCYGMDKPEIIALSNEILKKTSDLVKPLKNYMGGAVKIGASSPSYIDAAGEVMASFDGRRYGEAFGVHISSERNNGYTEIINFASKLDYNENRFNGNVVDLMITPTFIEDNFDKMVDLLLAGIQVGFFQLQMNVISAATLIDAKKHPDKHVDLVVRVWGFSAYFNDLPESYQDVLIKRALKNEDRKHEIGA